MNETTRLDLHDADGQWHSLMSAWLDGRLDEEGMARLDAELRSSPAARQAFREWIDLDVLLKDVAARVDADETAAASDASALSVAPASVVQPRPTRVGWIVASTVIAAGLAAVLWWRSEPPAKVAGVPGGCAVVGRLVDADVAGTRLQPGVSLGPGLIRLDRGLAQFEFFSGATLWVEGKAEIEIVSAWEARLRSGRVRAHVPPAARGFVVHAPGARLVDLGTAFGLNVAADGTAAVRVFDGEVIVHPTGGTDTRLVGGDAIDFDGGGRTLAGRAPASFLAIDDVTAAVEGHGRERRAAWSRWFEEARRDPRLVALYRFDPPQPPRLEGLVRNEAEPARRQRDGAAVGVTWTAGRWPGSDAVAFRRAGGRVRVAIDGEYHSMSLACWTRVDAVDRSYNSLFLTDGYDPGEPHWQIFADGSLMFSIAYPPDGERAGRHNQIYHSRPVFTADTLGDWHHVAVTYDGTSGEVAQYFDGRLVGREISPLHAPGRPIRIGPAEIGNWGLPTAGHRHPLRSLNGAIDEFAIYDSVVKPEEIAKMFEAGRVE